MTVETFLHFWTLHNESIIQWLLFAIVFFTTVLLVRSIMTRKESDHDADPAIQSIRNTLNKMMEQNAERAHSAPATSVDAPGSHPNTAAAVAAATEEHQRVIARLEKEMLGLKTELQNKPKEIDNTPFLARIKELEAKLAEYEILEDDIADLSLFKEENSRLKTELAALKAQMAGGTTSETASESKVEAAAPFTSPKTEVAAEPAAPVAPVESAIPAPEQADFVAEFQAAVESEPSITQPLGKDVSPTGDILAEFAEGEAQAEPAPSTEAKKP